MDFRPLAERLRPERLADFIGQKHLAGKEGLIRKLINKKSLISLIIWGPPGSGKTTLARLIAKETGAFFVEFSAVNLKSENLKEIFLKAKEELKLYSRRTILFVDEIHRLNKAQQALFLPYIEDGTIILIGSTTENPSFEVIASLLSRTRVIVLKPHSTEDLKILVKKALKELKLTIERKAQDFLIETASGDARILLTTLEIASQIKDQKQKTIRLTEIQKALQKKALLYDKKGEEHYNTISAFIKSLRASDVNAALYYLARMVEAGEDPLFIARRMVIFASEDIGITQPTALVVANEVFKACEVIGYPECAINLAHGVVYLALAKKDRSCYEAYLKAVSDVKKYGNLSIPLQIRNAPTLLMKNLGYGKGYQPYTKESLLPDKLKNKKYYLPK